MTQRSAESLEAVAARSNLVATAGEFIPRAFRTAAGSAETQHFDENDGSQASSGYVRSNEYYSRNREPKYSRASGGRAKRNEREVVGPPLQDGRLWRDGNREGKRKDQWADSEFQAHASGARGRQKDSREGVQYSEGPSEPGNSDPQRANSGITPRNGPRPRRPNGQYVSQNGDHRNYNGRNNSEDKVVTPKPPKENVKNHGQAFRSNEEQRNQSETGKNQMEVLIGQLTRGTLECLVCCDHVRQSQSTWSCPVCHHVMHLRCVTKWAKSSRAEEGWRCPACQHVSSDTPAEYRCFCGKAVEPSWNRADCPHSCGAVCGQQRPAPCPHKCTLPCHPGPCPPCQLYMSRECGCGRASRTVPCADGEAVQCGAPCRRTLNCGVHKCAMLCHRGDCEPCSETVAQECFCWWKKREVACTKETAGVEAFSCRTTCSKILSCDSHGCTLKCHEGPCPPCGLLPGRISHCPCGKSSLTQLKFEPRNSCTDPIPTCGNLCGKQLACGEPGARHECESECHIGACPPCTKETNVRCRCGHMNKALPCSQLLARSDDARCDRKCNKLRSCGKHKCREPCCIDVDHLCLLPCTRTLNCGLHHCGAPCHMGYCRPCPRDSFQELSCECGAEVKLPPVPCGSRRPMCSRPCTRAHPCTHTPTHTCHSSPKCPPCTLLVSMWCHGGHELRKAVFCHMQAFSCGIACGKALPCGRHSCPLPCHAGPCLKDGQSCTLPCLVSRPGCGHPCGVSCHEPPCPDAPCKEMVKVSCECGHRYSTRVCVDNAREYQRIATAQLASKMADLAAGQTVDLNEVATSSKKISFKTLECTEECKVLERNRRLAVGLQIRNPDLSAKLTPRYSDLLRQWAKKDARFCQMVHDKLTDLVQLAKQSKQKSRSYSFDSMNWEKRQFVHEYCQHFGCESVAYDQEPNRNVVATALRDKSWLPGLSLLEVIQRENGARKVPLPSNAKSKLVPTLKSMEVLPMKVPSASGASGSAWGQPTAPPGPSAHSASASTTDFHPQVDYFDMAPLE